MYREILNALLVETSNKEGLEEEIESHLDGHEHYDYIEEVYYLARRLFENSFFGGSQICLDYLKEHHEKL